MCIHLLMLIIEILPSISVLTRLLQIPYGFDDDASAAASATKGPPVSPRPSYSQGHTPFVNSRGPGEVIPTVVLGDSNSAVDPTLAPQKTPSEDPMMRQPWR